MRAASLTLVAVALSLPVPGIAQAQSQTPDTSWRGEAPSAKPRAAFVQKKTPWGDPDIQGIWNNVTGTPLQRPDALKDKALLTKEEAEEYEKQNEERRLRQEATPVNEQSAGARTGYSPNIWFETSGALSDNRTSLLLDRPDGRLPALTPAAQKAAEAEVAARKVSPADKPEDRGPYERCISRGLPGAMMPGFYNHNYQILQTPDYVAILVEMIHDVRIIPMDGRPHPGGAIKQWLGDSRGRWEGNTLVVETTNLRKVDYRTTTVFGTSEKGKVIERFTRIGPDAMDYKITVEDPLTYTETWTASIPMAKVPGPIFEYACHEGNYGLPNILAGHRKEEAEAAAKAAQTPKP